MSKSIGSSSGAVRQYSPSEEVKKKKSILQNIGVGSLSGISAVSMIQPLIYFKNMKQLGSHVKRNPRVWYRGVGGFAASFAPTIALQTAVKGIFSNIWDLGPVVAALAGGAFSALVVCPAEGIMIQQQKTGVGFFKTAEYVYTDYGIRGFYRALLPTAAREATFAAAYLGVTPIVKRKLESLGMHAWIAQILAGAGVGIAAAGISHPFDTVKTQQQGDLSMKMATVEALCKKGVFAGFAWRAAMLTTATTVIPFVQEKLDKIVEKLKN